MTQQALQTRGSGAQHATPLRRVIPIRASSMPDLMDCPARWKAIHLDRMPTRKNTAAKLGTSLHVGLAEFDRRRLVGEADQMPAAQAAFADELAKKEDDLTWESGEQERAQKIGLELLSRYAQIIAPTRQFVAIELKCPDLDVVVEGIVLRLTGTADRIRKVEGVGFGVSDFKSGEQAVRADGRVVVSPHKAQLGVYEVLAARAMGEQMAAPAEIIGLQCNGKARVGVGEVPRAAESLLGSEENPGSLVYAARILKDGLFWGNPRGLLCSEKFCPAFKQCKFR